MAARSDQESMVLICQPEIVAQIGSQLGYKNIGGPLSSFPRNRESSGPSKPWIPARAGYRQLGRNDGRNMLGISYEERGDVVD